MLIAEVCCQSWNPWHHPYTRHAAWCQNYKKESEENIKKNQEYNKKGGFYEIGYPSDGIHHMKEAK